ncbi:iron-siderophore ABC transporter substrate-binding protein [Gordonia sp. CPCC 205515]|uniref:ABC transporter substrate-binding protein n=1 Tax=Gordonia sp. CPCC 205515 TaxID=3140791 RepID=UPI003AF389BE
MRKNRRIGLPFVAAVLALMVALVAGCSAPDDDASSSSDAEYAPVTISHQYGETTIPKRPTRVVTMSSDWTDTLAALNVPITAEFVQQGYAGPNNHFEWTPQHDSEVVVVGASEVPKVDDIARFNPDVILAGYVPDQQYYDQLSKLAPTIPVMKQGATVDTWEDVATTTGKIFGKQDEAQALVDKTNTQIADFQKAHPNAMGKTFTFAQFRGASGFGAVTTTNDSSAGLLAQLGFTLNPKLAAEYKEGGPTRTVISPERIDLIDSDLIVAWTLTDRSAIEQVPGWSNLKAVKNDTVAYITNDNAAAFSVPSAPSVGYVINLLNPIAARL